jgi:hypothetical protein
MAGQGFVTEASLRALLEPLIGRLESLQQDVSWIKNTLEQRPPRARARPSEASHAARKGTTSSSPIVLDGADAMDEDSTDSDSDEPMVGKEKETH